MSKPNFLDGDVGLLANVSGVSQPNTSCCETLYHIDTVSPTLQPVSLLLRWLFVIIEAHVCVQVTGMTLSHHKRLQYNLYLSSVMIGNATFFSNVTNAYLPLLWFDEVTCIMEGSVA